MKVFLGGTCNDSTWRNDLIPLLKIPYFDPVVEDWTPECQAQEIRERENATLVLYVITPKMTGIYAIAEAVDDSNKRPRQTILCVLPADGDAEFSPAQWKSLQAVAAMVIRNGGWAVKTLEDVADLVNGVAVNIAVA